MSAPIELTADALLVVLRQAMSGVRGVGSLRRLSGGANLETWALNAATTQGEQRLVLRRTPSGTGERAHNLLALEVEAQVIIAVAAAGVPAPTVRCVLRPQDGLGQGFVMDYVEGETLASRILRAPEFSTARPRLAHQCGRILAQIHQVDTRRLPQLRLSPARIEHARYDSAYRAHGHPHPVFDLALRWLADNMPGDDVAPTLVHGDFRNGNLIIGPEGIRTVLDWEVAHVGDPMEDLGWLCVNSWRFGNVDRPVGGFGAREELFAGYEEGGGKVDPARVKFWEVFGSLRWGVGCMSMYDVFRRGIDRSVERAAIGRRASETEIDLLRLIAPRKRA